MRPRRPVASAESTPVTPDEALTAFSPTLGRSGVALAVSGGADSLSLLHLWADARALAPNLPRAVVLTVDHRLRPEAAAEAAFVAEVAADRGLAHRTLAWVGAKPTANLQAEARAARRLLLVEAAADLGLDTLLLAHHADDQAETFLSRLARGSGVVGLAAMAK
ncbi:MAG: tRNA lysidine(34) synthetase TilS, partial [Phyllobacteriaceae bacterium]|nr:tRNA lysidine(34) synthetase TilS [Phyllobacteriaceae bacterium]